MYHGQLSGESSPPTLCRSIIEIIESIWFTFQQRRCSTGGQNSNTMNSLRLSIHGVPEDEKNEDDFIKYSIKVRCNQQIMLNPLLEDGQANGLQNFVYDMQMLVEGSLLTILLPNEKDPDLALATDVSFTLGPESSASFLKVMNETSIKKDFDDAAIICLKTFMSFSSMMKAGKDLVDYLCAFKLMNPNVSLSFQMDGPNTSQLNLCDSEEIPCGSHLLYAHPELCEIRNHDFDYVCGKPIFHHSGIKKIKFPVPEHQKAFGNSISCILCFIPLNENDDVAVVEDRNISTNDFIHGRAILRAYNKDCLPMDTVTFIKHFNCPPQSLVPWDQYGIQLKKSFHPKCYPYHIQWPIRMSSKSMHPPEIVNCKNVLLYFCFILNEMDVDEDLMINDSSNLKDISDPLKECAKFCMEAVFSEHQDMSPCMPENRSNDALCYWIPNIANSLEEIFTKSTNAEFREKFGQYIPANGGIRSHLESSLWQTLRPVTYREYDDGLQMLSLNCDSGQKENPNGKALDIMHCDKNQDILTLASVNDDKHEKEKDPLSVGSENTCRKDYAVNCEEPYSTNDHASTSSSIYISHRSNDDKNKKCENEISFKSCNDLSNGKINMQEEKKLHDNDAISILDLPSENVCLEGYRLSQQGKLPNKHETVEKYNTNSKIDINSSFITGLKEILEKQDDSKKISPSHLDLYCNFENASTKNKSQRRLVKKRSFEEREVGLISEDFHPDVEDWMDLEFDMNQMKKLRLCDSEPVVKMKTSNHSKCVNRDEKCEMNNKTKNISDFRCKDLEDKSEDHEGEKKCSEIRQKSAIDDELCCDEVDKLRIINASRKAKVMQERDEAIDFPNTQVTEPEDFLLVLNKLDDFFSGVKNIKENKESNSLKENPDIAIYTPPEAIQDNGKISPSKEQDSNALNDKQDVKNDIPIDKIQDILKRTPYMEQTLNSLESKDIDDGIPSVKIQDHIHMSCDMEQDLNNMTESQEVEIDVLSQEIQDHVHIMSCDMEQASNSMTESQEVEIDVLSQEIQDYVHIMSCDTKQASNSITTHNYDEEIDVLSQITQDHSQIMTSCSEQESNALKKNEDLDYNTPTRENEDCVLVNPFKEEESCILNNNLNAITGVPLGEIQDDIQALGDCLTLAISKSGVGEQRCELGNKINTINGLECNYTEGKRVNDENDLDSSNSKQIGLLGDNFLSNNVDTRRSIDTFEGWNDSQANQASELDERSDVVDRFNSQLTEPEDFQNVLDELDDFFSSAKNIKTDKEAYALEKFHESERNLTIEDEYVIKENIQEIIDYVAPKESNVSVEIEQDLAMEGIQMQNKILTTSLETQESYVRTECQDKARPFSVEVVHNCTQLSTDPPPLDASRSDEDHLLIEDEDWFDSEKLTDWYDSMLI